MKVKGNPVGRLVDILDSLQHQPHQLALREAWANALECDKHNFMELMRLIVDVNQLTKDARNAVSEVPDLDERLYLDPFNYVERLLAVTNLESTLGNHIACLSATTMQGLRFGEHLLDREKRATASIPTDEIVDLMRALSELLQQVLDSDLPENLKRLFAKNLEQLRHALIAFKITGAEGLSDEIDRSIGSILRHQTEIKETTNEDGKSIVTSFFTLLERINESATFTQNAAALVPVITGFLAVIS